MATFSIEDVGEMEGKTWFQTTAGLTTRVRRNPLLGGFGENTQFEFDEDRSNPNSRERIEDIGPCETEISIKAWGNYPFMDSSPNIDYTTEWTIVFRPDRNQVIISLEGSHNTFPNYEGLVNSETSYPFSTNASGPSLWNLGFRWKNIKSTTTVFTP